MGRAQFADEFQLGLEINVMRQLKVLHKPLRFDVIAVIENEFLILCGGIRLLAEL